MLLLLAAHTRTHARIVPCHAALTVMSHCTAAPPATPPLLCTQHPFGTALHRCRCACLPPTRTHARIVPCHAALTVMSACAPSLHCSGSRHWAAALPLRYCTAPLLLRLLASHTRTHAASCPCHAALTVMSPCAPLTDSWGCGVSWAGAESRARGG